MSILTVTPGDAVYSMFGHTAIRVQDPMQSLDLTFNYGTFSFDDPVLFALRFSYGQLDYLLSAAESERSLTVYRLVERRNAIEQELNLTLAERDSVYRYLLNNARPENRVYRYDFLKDNCSTRVRDVLERVLSGRLAFSERPTPYTYRDLLDRYGQSKPGLDAGYDLLLGAGVDVRINRRQTMFLPIELAAEFDSARVVRGGRSEPLVARRDTLFVVREDRYSHRAFPWPMLVTLLLFGFFSIAWWRDIRLKERRRRAADVILFSVVGVIGIVISYMWFVSLHWVADTNLHLLWALPTHLVAAVLLGLGKYSRPLKYYLLGTAILCAVLMAAWFFLPQAMNPVYFPVVATIAMRAAVLGVQMPQLKTDTPE